MNRQITIAEYGTFFALKNGSETLATSPIKEPLEELAKRYNAHDKLVETLKRARNIEARSNWNNDVYGYVVDKGAMDSLCVALGKARLIDHEPNAHCGCDSCEAQTAEVDREHLRDELEAATGQTYNDEALQAHIHATGS